MEQEMRRKIRLGKKEKAILDFLKDKPQGVWKQDILQHFSWANKYNGVISKRLEKMQEKGLIEIKSEINPESGRYKQRVYLNQ